MLYLDVSTAGQWYPADPRLDPTRLSPFYFPALGAHPNQQGWLALRPTVSGPVRFGYLVNAGPGGTPTRGTASWPSASPSAGSAPI